MGFLDSIKNAFGGKKAEADVTVSPSQALREAGIDPGGLKFGFGGDGSVTVSGEIADEADRGKIIETLTGLAGVTAVNDQMTVAVAAPPEAEAPPPSDSAPEASAQAPAAEAERAPEAGASQGRTYTVQPGDTLWKISEEHYGAGSKYMQIFEANRDLLEDPNKIFPGQELKIPDLDD